MRLTATLFLLALSVCPLAAAQDAGKAARPPSGKANQAAGAGVEEVLGEAKKYIGLLKSAQPAQAMEAYWDFDEMLSGIFGKDLERHSPAERQEMKKLLTGVIRGAYEDPQLVKLMREAKVEKLRAEPAKDGVTTVRFDVLIGDSRLPNVLHFRKKGKAWRVVDGGVEGQLLVPSLRKGYDSLQGKVTPLHFVRELAKPPEQPQSSEPAPAKPAPAPAKP